MKCHVDLGQTCLGASRDIGFLFHRTSFDRKRESGGCSTERRTFEHTAQFSSLQKTRPSSQYQNSYLDLAVDRETAMLSTLADKFKLKSVCNLVVCSAEHVLLLSVQRRVGMVVWEQGATAREMIN